jgi:hypothetical protein
MPSCHICGNKWSEGHAGWCGDEQEKQDTDGEINSLKAQLAQAEARLATAKIALEDIKAHSVKPFVGYKWRNYIHVVADEALTALAGRDAREGG